MIRQVFSSAALWTTLACAAMAQAPQIFSVQVPGNSNPTVVSPGAVVHITGAGLGTSPSAVSISAGGANAYVIAAGDAALDVQLPVSLPVQSPATLTITTPGGSASTTVQVAYASPAFSGVAAGSNIPYVTDYKDQSSNVVSFRVDAQHPVVPGDYLVLQATGLGVTVAPVGGPPAPTGITPAGSSYTAQVQPIVNVGSLLIPSSVTKATLIPGEVGVFAVNFQLPENGVTIGSDPISLNVSNSTTVPLTLPVDDGLATISGIVNGASFAANTPVAPGSIASIFSTNLESVVYHGIFPNHVVHNTSTAMNYLPAPIYDLVGSDNQMNVQIPVDLPTTGSITVVITNSKGEGKPFTLQMAPAAPGIFRIQGPGSGSQNAAVLFSGKKWYAMSSAFAQSLGIYTNCPAGGVNPQAYCGQPAKAGDDLEIYATGLGIATPGGDPNGIPLATGATAPVNPLVHYETPETPTVTIGGVSARVTFSGIAPGFAGLYQVNVVVPSGVAPGDAVPVTIEMPSSSITDTATIAVQ